MNIIQAMMGLVLAGAGELPADHAGTEPFFVPEVENSQEQVVLKVESHGCTDKKDFRVRAGRSGSLIVERLRKDLCREEPRFIELRYSHEELGLNKPAPALRGQRYAER